MNFTFQKTLSFLLVIFTIFIFVVFYPSFYCCQRKGGNGHHLYFKLLSALWEIHNIYILLRASIPLNFEQCQCIQGKIKISLCFGKLLHEYMPPLFCADVRVYTIIPDSFLCIYTTYYLRLLTQWLASRGFPGPAYRSVCSISPSPLEPLASCGKCCHVNAYSKMSIFSMHN